MRGQDAGFTIGELLSVFVVVLIVGALMLPFIRYNNRKMDRTVCANNLRQVGLALYIYARENDGNFPDSLAKLYEEQYLADKKVMDCPASKNTGTLKGLDYIYTAGLNVRNLSVAPLVCDKKENHTDGGGNVLQVNGSVLWNG